MVGSGPYDLWIGGLELQIPRLRSEVVTFLVRASESMELLDG